VRRAGRRGARGRAAVERCGWERRGLGLFFLCFFFPFLSSLHIFSTLLASLLFISISLHHTTLFFSPVFYTSFPFLSLLPPTLLYSPLLYPLLISSPLFSCLYPRAPSPKIGESGFASSGFSLRCFTVSGCVAHCLAASSSLPTLFRCFVASVVSLLHGSLHRGIRMKGIVEIVLGVVDAILSLLWGMVRR